MRKAHRNNAIRSRIIGKLLTRRQIELDRGRVHRLGYVVDGDYGRNERHAGKYFAAPL